MASASLFALLKSVAAPLGNVRFESRFFTTAHEGSLMNENAATCVVTDFDHAALENAVFVDLPKVTVVPMERRRFATLRARGCSSEYETRCEPFLVHGVESVWKEHRDKFEYVENAVNFLYANGFHRLEAQEERKWKIIMNGEDNVDGKTVPNIVVAIFSKPLLTTEVPIDATMSETIVDADYQAAGIATISLRPEPDLIGVKSCDDEAKTNHIRYEVRGHQDYPEAFKYFEDILNVLSESGYYRLDPVKEDLWKQFIQMVKFNANPDNPPDRDKTLKYVFAKGEMSPPTGHSFIH